MTKNMLKSLSEAGPGEVLPCFALTQVLSFSAELYELTNIHAPLNSVNRICVHVQSHLSIQSLNTTQIRTFSNERNQIHMCNLLQSTFCSPFSTIGLSPLSNHLIIHLPWFGLRCLFCIFNLVHPWSPILPHHFLFNFVHPFFPI